jgi:hypothetical protein
MSISLSSGKSGKKEAGIWEWKKDLMKIIQNMAGLRKLTASKPSTAAIGERRRWVTTANCTVYNG